MTFCNVILAFSDYHKKCPAKMRSQVCIALFVSSLEQCIMAWKLGRLRNHCVLFVGVAMLIKCFICIFVVRREIVLIL